MPYQPTWNNPYVTSNPYGASPVMPTMQPYQQPFNGIVKVNGPESAMQRQLPPNSTSEPMFDNNGKVFYVVSTDGTGSKTIETFDWCQHVEVAPIQVDGASFVSRQEFDEFAARVNAVIGATHGPDGTVRTEDDGNGTHTV